MMWQHSPYVYLVCFLARDESELKVFSLPPFNHFEGDGLVKLELDHFRNPKRKNNITFPTIDGICISSTARISLGPWRCACCAGWDR